MKKEDIVELTTDELRLRLQEEKTMYSKLILNTWFDEITTVLPAIRKYCYCYLITSILQGYLLGAGLN